MESTKGSALNGGASVAGGTGWPPPLRGWEFQQHVAAQANLAFQP